MMLFNANAQKPHEDTIPPLNAALQLSLAFNGSYTDVHGYSLSNIVPSFMYWRTPNTINLVNIESLSFSRDTFPLDTVASQQGKSNVYYKTSIAVSWEQDYHYFFPHHPEIGFYFGNAFYVSYYHQKYNYDPITGGPWADTYVKLTFGMNFGARYFFNRKYYLDLSFPLRDIAGFSVDVNNNKTISYELTTFDLKFFNIDTYTVRFGVGVRILTKGK